MERITKKIQISSTELERSGGGVVDNTLDNQSRDRMIDPRFSGLSDETLKQGPAPFDLVVGGTLNQTSLTHSLTHSRNSTVKVTWRNNRTIKEMIKDNANETGRFSTFSSFVFFSNPIRTTYQT